jgi:hypothetical protein
VVRAPAHLADRAADVHEALMAWLTATYPRENPLVILSACTYEVGRIAGQFGAHLSEGEQQRMLDGIRRAMAAHLRAYRAGQHT